MSLIGGLSIGNVVSIVMLKEFMCITLKMPTLNYTLVKKIPLIVLKYFTSILTVPSTYVPVESLDVQSISFILFLKF